MGSYLNCVSQTFDRMQMAMGKGLNFVSKGSGCQFICFKLFRLGVMLIYSAVRLVNSVSSFSCLQIITIVVEVGEKGGRVCHSRRSE